MDASDIKKIANLARIAVDDETSTEVAERITRVIDLVNQLQSAETEGITPMAHPLDMEHSLSDAHGLREDQVSEDNQRDALLDLAPASEECLFLVPKVIE